MVAAVIYHPPKADDISIRDHLFHSLALVESKYPNCGFLICGNLNRLDINSLLTHFHLKQSLRCLLTKMLRFFRPCANEHAINFTLHHWPSHRLVFQTTALW